MEELIKKILSISRAVGSKNFEFMKARGYRRIGIGQLAIVRIVADHPGVCADDICKMLELDKATVAVALKHLMVSGFVRREVDENDKRRKLLFATDKLNVIGDEIQELLRKQVAQLTYGFTDSDITILGDYLDRIRENLKRLN